MTDSAGVLRFCHLCGADRDVENLVRHPRFEVVRCRTCRLVFQATCGAAADAGRLYDSIYADRPDTAARPSRLGPFMRDEDMLREVSLRHPRAGSFIDIGCSYGDLVGLFRDAGWKAFGIDVSEHAVKWAASRGLECRVASVEAYEPTVLFDAAVMKHVLEHCRSPLDVLARIRPWLADGGTLHVRVPNFESEILGRHPCLLPGEIKPFEHLYYFSRNTLTALFNKAGFACEIRTRGAFGLADIVNHLIRGRLVLRDDWQRMNCFTEPERKRGYLRAKRIYERILPRLNLITWGPEDREILAVAWRKGG